MFKTLLGFFFRGRRSLIAVPLFALMGFAGWEAFRYWWDHGFSRGTYDGVVRKVSIKGPPYCKYASIELVVPGGTLAVPKLVEFTLDDSHDGTPLLGKFEEAERTQKNVTVRYRQDHLQWWQCVPVEYHALEIQ